MYTLKMNDGTEVLVNLCGASGGVLWITAPMTISDAFCNFCDPWLTQRMEFHYGEMVDVYEGYTELIALIADDDGNTKTALRRAAV